SEPPPKIACAGKAGARFLGGGLRPPSEPPPKIACAGKAGAGFLGGGLRPPSEPPPKLACAGKAGARTPATPHGAAGDPGHLALPQPPRPLRRLLHRAPLGGGLRPPSKPPPKIACAGKAGARTPVASHGAVGDPGHLALPQLPRPLRRLLHRADEGT